MTRGGVLRHSTRDTALVFGAVTHGVILMTVPSAAVIALCLWWSANTVAHNFIHLPFFRAPWANRVFSAYLSLILGLPQSLWRDRHLAHHADRRWKPHWSRQFMIDSAFAAALWTYMISRGPAFFLGTFAAGWIGGLLLCQVHGYFEHSRGTVSYYGTLYNLAFFNDGYHREHHARPGMHWSALAGASHHDEPSSRWPAVMRWLEWPLLDALERVVLRSSTLQRFVVACHARAFRRLLSRLPPVNRVTIVGGGIFPRTALVIRRLAPNAEITIVDQSAASLQCARPYLDARMRIVRMRFAADQCEATDLLILPLAFVGDRRRYYDHPPARAVAIHDWVWRRRGDGFLVSFLLLKRLNLVRR